MTTMPKVASLAMPPKMKPVVNHPAVAEYISQWNDMANELDRVRADLERLRNELEIERRVNGELQHGIDGERAQKEKFQRYSIALNHHVATLHSIAAQALDESQKAAMEPAKKLEAPPIGIDELEAGVAEIAAKFGPRQHEGEP